jgi:phytoene dehydrogenase-like protein
MTTYDAIVIGAGHNGLAAALYLARAGWRTLVLERNERVGGAVMSGEITRPGFIHDLYSTNQNLFVASPVYAEFRDDLARHGLRYRTSTKPFCNVFPDGASLRVYGDPDRTVELLRQHNPQDAEGWTRLYAHYKQFGRALGPLYQTPLPSVGTVLGLGKAVQAVGMNELLQLGQIILSSTRELGESYFASEEARALMATWGMHLDFGPDVAGGALFPFQESFADMEGGMAIAEGGASRMVDALASLIREYGGEIRTETEVRRVLVSDGRATGVELEGGEQALARRAVIANVTPTVLFERLLAPDALPSAFLRKVRRYSFGPGTMMVHLALRGPAQWRAGADVGEFAYVHIAPYVDDLAQTYTDALRGYLPSSPLLIVGQTSVVDPSRTPGDEHILWIQVRALPAQIKGDTAGEIAARTWEEAKELYADRVIQKLETYAPGIRDLILERVVYSPEDLERHNPNLQGGDSVAGSHHLRQFFLFRPFPGWSKYKMPLDGLYMVGAATWPGAGTNALSGYLTAQELLQPHATRNRLIGGGVAVGVAAAATAVAARRGRRAS